MHIQPRLALVGLLSTCALVILPTESAKAQYNFVLPSLKNGCVSSSTHPDCYDDQNAVRASGFSHFDGSGSPTPTPPDDVPALLKAKPLWNRLKDTSYSMHVIDKDKPKTLLEIIKGREIYTDEDHNYWTKFNGDWYVKMAHQFDIGQENDLWCEFLPSCNGSGGFAKINNVGVDGATIFFAPILSEKAPQDQKNRINLGDWLRARPTEYDLARPETVNARANFFVGGRGIGFPYNAATRSDQAFWNHLALVWVNPAQLFRPAQNPNITIKDFAATSNHLGDIQGTPSIDWCINQFTNVVDPTKNGACDMADVSQGQVQGNRFDQFKEYYLSYFNAGSNDDGTENFFPFPFTGLGVTYDPYYQAQLEAAANTEAGLALILPKLIGTSEFVYAIPALGQSVTADTALMYLDEVYPIINTVPGPLPILGVGAGFAFTRRLRRRIRQASPVSPQRSLEVKA
jgi:hypothetical protein